METPVKADVLNDLLIKTQYNPEERKFLVEGFKKGFTLGFQGPMNRKDTSNNIPFTPGVGSKSEMWEKVMKEVKLKRYLGPWKENKIPFEHFVQSPIGLVPKAGGQTTLIFHLSYKFPNGNESINFWTSKELCTVKYRDLDFAIQNCIKMLKKNAKNGTPVIQHLFCGKTELKSAFRWLPLLSWCFKLLLIKAQHPHTGDWFFFADKCLPFGSSISCSHFQRLSNAIRHIVESLERIYDIITNYLDDFLFAHFIRAECNRIMRCFMKVCELINFPVADEKTEWASECVIFLGLLLNGKYFLVMIPEDKRKVAINILDRFATGNKVTIKEVQVLTGTLNFLNKAIVPGRVFTRRMYNFLEMKSQTKEGIQLKQHHHIKVTWEFKNDCEM